MNIMKTNKFYLKVFGIDLQNARGRSLLETVENVLLLIPLSAILFAGTAYLMFETKTVNEMTDCFYTVSGFVLLSSWYLVFIKRKAFANEILDDLERMVNLRLNGISMQTFRTTDKQIETFSKYVMVLSIIAASGVYVMPFLSPIYHLVMATYTPDAWYLPYKVLFPFDANRTSGFVIALIICEIAGLTATVFFAVMISVYVGVCWFFVACLSESTTILRQIDDILNVEVLKTRFKQQIIEHLLEFIRFHAWSGQFRSNFSDFMSLLIFMIIAVFVVCICALMYQIQVSAENVSLQLYQSIGSCSMALSCMFLYCYLGTIVTTKCAGINDAVYQSLWYRYPLHLQSYVIHVMRFAQKPFYLSGFGVMQCSLESFTSLINTSVSVYMLFRNIGKS